MKLTLEQSFATAVRPSPRVLRTASMFGLGVDESHEIHIVPRAAIELPAAGIVFITGPSGGGKSTVLKLIAAHLRSRDVRVLDLNDLPPLPDAPLVDVFDAPLERATSLLAMAGLGDAFLMLRRPCELSDGQRARLRIAQAMHLASQSPASTILADEFSATLDRLTARIIAANIRRWIDRQAQTHVTFIAATTHDDLLEPLSPDLLIYKGLGDEMEMRTKPSRHREGVLSGAVTSTPPRHARDADADADADDPFANLRIEPGLPRDYQALSQFHYKGSKIGVVTTTYRMVHESRSIVGRYLKRRSETQIIGVLLRALPHLACSLRDVATRGRYREGLSLRESAVVLNREMRTISRVVIHPQWRGLGLAVRLVRHALADPEPGQVYTEGLAAMGHVHPFFERAGMTRFDRPPRREHARLLDALERIEIEPFMLASPRAFLQKLRERDDMMQVWFEHELARWARSGARRRRRERACGERSIEEMLALARDQLLTLPVYYVYRHQRDGTDEGQ